jgi:hypothetical protein
MHGRFTLRIQQLAVIAGRGGRWLLPWACVLVLSMIVAYIAGQALVASPSWAQAAQEAERTTGAASNSTSTDIVLMLSSVDSAGTPMSVVCISTRNRVAADVLVVSPQDMATVVAHLCKPFDPRVGG